MKPLTRDARFFVQGVVEYLRKEKAAKAAVPKVQALLRKVTTQDHRENHAVVESAVTLTEFEVRRLKEALSEMVHHQVRITTKMNRDLVAGLRIHVGDWIVDTSFLSQLSEMAHMVDG